jgi:hypothetical protein
VHDGKCAGRRSGGQPSYRHGSTSFRFENPICRWPKQHHVGPTIVESKLYRGFHDFEPLSDFTQDLFFGQAEQCRFVSQCDVPKGTTAAFGLQDHLICARKETVPLFHAAEWLSYTNLTHARMRFELIYQLPVLR